jgi:hypothetical protein
VPDPSGAVGFVLAIDPTQAACIREMYRLLVHERVPLTRVVKQLNAAGHRSDCGAVWTKQTLSRWAHGDGPSTAAGAWRWRELRVPIPPILTAAEHAEWMAWKRDTATPATRHTTYLLGGRVRTPCGRYFHGRTAGTQNPVYVPTPAADTRRRPGPLRVPVHPGRAAGALMWGRTSQSDSRLNKQNGRLMSRGLDPRQPRV